jgi:hypothetical protein
MSTKWNWEDTCGGQYPLRGMHKDGTIFEYKQSRCLTVPNCEIIVYEHYEVGGFSLRMRLTDGPAWRTIFDVILPSNIKTLACAQRKAPSIVRREMSIILKEQMDKYQRILDALKKPTP